MVLSLVALLSMPSLSNSCACASHWTLLLTGDIPLPGPHRRHSYIWCETTYQNTLFEVRISGSGDSEDSELGLELKRHTDDDIGPHQLAAAARVVPVARFADKEYDLNGIEDIITDAARDATGRSRTCEDWVLRMVGALGEKGYVEPEQRKTVVHIIQGYQQCAIAMRNTAN